MKNRVSYIIHLIFYPFIPVILVLSSMVDSPALRWGIGIATALTTGLFVALDTYCPHCHRFGLFPRAHWKHSGYCTHCGKLVEWTECAEGAYD